MLGVWAPIQTEISCQATLLANSSPSRYPTPLLYALPRETFLDSPLAKP